MNQTWEKRAKLDYNEFYASINRVYEIQQEYLQKLINQNRNTVFGKAHHFEKINTIQDYQEKVPIRDYEEMDPWLNELKNNQQNILTKDPVILFEPTGGTSSGSKLIPYNQNLKGEFQKAINVWLMNIKEYKPEALNGLSYWSVSPIVQKENELFDTKIPVGFENDYDYLGWSKEEANKLFVVPDEIKNIKNIDDFFYVTALFLLRAKNLSFISVWSPTFLKLITDVIENNLSRLVNDIRSGIISLKNKENLAILSPYIKSDKKRANEIIQIAEKMDHSTFGNIWPNLEMISCWADATSKSYFNEIKNRFDGVFIQPKGLLATEAIISIPLIEAKGAVPAYTSHFLEFLPENDKENPRLIHELEQNEEYFIVISTGGGLYRYELKDKISVKGKFKNLPLIEFIGRGQTMDLVGEKLDETFVLKCINKFESVSKISSDFRLFAPQRNERCTNYGLFIESDQLKNHKTDQLELIFDQILCNSYHYKYAREIEQLGRVKVYKIKDGLVKYTKRCYEDGQKIGDIKSVIIERRFDWSDYLLNDKKSEK